MVSENEKKQKAKHKRKQKARKRAEKKRTASLDPQQQALEKKSNIAVPTPAQQAKNLPKEAPKTDTTPKVSHQTPLSISTVAVKKTTLSDTTIGKAKGRPAPDVHFSSPASGHLDSKSKPTKTDPKKPLTKLKSPHLSAKPDAPEFQQSQEILEKKRDPAKISSPGSAPLSSHHDKTSQVYTAEPKKALTKTEKIDMSIKTQSPAAQEVPKKMEAKLDVEREDDTTSSSGSSSEEENEDERRKNDNKIASRQIIPRWMVDRKVIGLNFREGSSESNSDDEVIPHGKTDERQIAAGKAEVVRDEDTSSSESSFEEESEDDNGVDSVNISLKKEASPQLPDLKVIGLDFDVRSFESSSDDEEIAEEKSEILQDIKHKTRNAVKDDTSTPESSSEDGSQEESSDDENATEISVVNPTPAATFQKPDVAGVGKIPSSSHVLEAEKLPRPLKRQKITADDDDINSEGTLSPLKGDPSLIVPQNTPVGPASLSGQPAFTYTNKIVTVYDDNGGVTFLQKVDEKKSITKESSTGLGTHKAAQRIGVPEWFPNKIQEICLVQCFDNGNESLPWKSITELTKYKAYLEAIRRRRWKRYIRAGEKRHNFSENLKDFGNDHNSMSTILTNHTLAKLYRYYLRQHQEWKKKAIKVMQSLDRVVKGIRVLDAVMEGVFGAEREVYEQYLA